VIHGITFKGDIMKQTFLVILMPRRGQTLIQCLSEKGVDTKSPFFSHSRDRINTPRCTFYLRDFGRLKEHHLRGLSLDGVYVCEKLRSVLSDDFLRLMKIYLRKEISNKEIIYI